MLFNVPTGYEINFIVNLFLALVSGYIIGRERSSRGKSAGVSTISFVTAGSMVFAFISQLLNPALPTAMAGQIITGVGFLGAGIILRQEKENKVRNMTTAATIWFSASIGMAIGFNLYFIALLATLYGFFLPKIPTINFISRKKKK
jgi:putative Mg2+ transporter-C (MgtC) family protein